MDRIERSEETYARLFGPRDVTVHEDDPELMEMLRGLIFGDIFSLGDLDDRTRELITVVLLVTQQTLPQLGAHVGAALNVGITPLEVREAIYQCAPFIGFPKTLNALHVANEVFTQRGIELPLPSAATVGQEERYDAGHAMQFPLYGNAMRENLADLPGDWGQTVPRLLTEFCFGDLYTRTGLDVPTRELLVLAILVALGDAPVQIFSHAIGNFQAGNSKEKLVAVIVHAFPYVGFPRAVNALRIVKEL